MLLRVGRGRGAVHGAAQRGRGRGSVHGDFWRERGQGLCPRCLEEWGLQGCCVHGTSLSGKGQGCWVHSTSEWEGAVVLSMVPLTVGGAGVLCPQYLSKWEGQWCCVHSTSHSGRAQGCCVHGTSHTGRAQGSCGARPRPPAPGGTVSGNAASCQDNRTASPFL